MSGYSYLFLNAQSKILSSKLEIKSKNISTFSEKKIAPTTSTTLVENEKNKTNLADVEFLNFFIKKGKEGIPVLKFRDFFSF